jgi:glycosyltransferase involved in cell wall biosynthesis
MAAVIIDPACNFYYSSFFIRGLLELYKSEVSFSSKPFNNLNYLSDTHILAFVIIENQSLKKIVIDFADAPDINKMFLSWCDIYGKINYRKSEVENEKIITAPPNYALKIWKKPIAGYFGLINYLRSYQRTIPFYPFIARYLMAASRAYDISGIAEAHLNYIFFVSTLWKTQEVTNQYRANFIRACKSIEDIQFEGGLIPDTSDYESKYKDLIVNKLFKYEEYIEKVKSSMVVFNTPAYSLCHGWKLAEFLAMGKAIISTPFANELPAPLIHGENIYFVSGTTEDIVIAINFIKNNTLLRSKLENGAFDYYNKYLKPSMAINNILHHL